MSDIHAFANDLGPDLSAEVEAILAAVSELTDEQALALYEALSPRFAMEEDEYGVNFDMVAEVSAQIRAVRAMRRSVMLDSGAIRAGVPARELKEVVTASNTLLSTLMKMHEKLLNFNRMRAIEIATAKALEAVPDDVKERYFAALEAELETIQ